MNRYSNCQIKLDSKKVYKLIRIKYDSVANYARLRGISRTRIIQVVSRPHFSKEEKCLQRLAGDLDVSIETILL